MSDLIYQVTILYKDKETQCLFKDVVAILAPYVSSDKENRGFNRRFDACVHIAVMRAKKDFLKTYGNHFTVVDAKNGTMVQYIGHETNLNRIRY